MVGIGVDLVYEYVKINQSTLLTVWFLVVHFQKGSTFVHSGSHQARNHAIGVVLCFMEKPEAKSFMVSE